MIPVRFQHAKYEDVPAKIQALFDAIPKSKRGLYIHGNVGTGKTHFAYALKKKWDVPTTVEASKKDNSVKVSKGRTAIFWNTTELLREMRRDFDSEQKSNVVDYLLDNDNESLLFLDDLGSEKMSDWVAETFYLIINSRYNNVVPTIFTSNFCIPDLAERIGERTVSRIVEMCDVVELVGSDRRQINSKKIPIKI